MVLEGCLPAVLECRAGLECPVDLEIHRLRRRNNRNSKTPYDESMGLRQPAALAKDSFASAAGWRLYL